MNERKYYFITYKEGNLIENCLIDYEPLEFLKRYKKSRILFYKEISKNVYDKWDKEVSG